VIPVVRINYDCRHYGLVKKLKFAPVRINYEKNMLFLLWWSVLRQNVVTSNTLLCGLYKKISFFLKSIIFIAGMKVLYALDILTYLAIFVDSVPFGVCGGAPCGLFFK
jgi:hypothetical protein